MSLTLIMFVGFICIFSRSRIRAQYEYSWYDEKCDFFAYEEAKEKLTNGEGWDVIWGDRV